MAITRAELRRRIGRRMGELIVIRSTLAGSNVTFIDSFNLAVEAGSLRGREVVFTAGTAANIGLVRRVEDNSRTATSITITPALSAVTALNDEAELFHLRSVGPRVDAIHDAINSAITALGPSQPTTYTFTAAFDRESPTIAIPTNFGRITGLESHDAGVDTIWRSQPALWKVDKANRTLTINDVQRYDMDTHLVRLVGMTIADSLENDSETTVIDPEWLVLEAVAQLREAGLANASDRGNAERAAFFARQQADRLRARAIPRALPNSVWV